MHSRFPRDLPESLRPRPGMVNHLQVSVACASYCVGSSFYICFSIFEPCQHPQACSFSVSLICESLHEQDTEMIARAGVLMVLFLSLNIWSLLIPRLLVHACLLASRWKP